MRSQCSPLASRYLPSSSPVTTCFKRSLVNSTWPRWRLPPPWLRLCHPRHRRAHHPHKARCHPQHTRHPRTTTRNTRLMTIRRSLLMSLQQRVIAAVVHTIQLVDWRHLGMIDADLATLGSWSIRPACKKCAKRSPRRRSSRSSISSTKHHHDLWRLSRAFHHRAGTMATVTRSAWTQASALTWPLAWPTTLVFYHLPPHPLFIHLLLLAMMLPYLFIASGHLSSPLLFHPYNCAMFLSLRI
jgi:hypothetical protein